MCVVNTLSCQVTEEFEEQFLALVGMTEIALRRRQCIQVIVESCFGAVEIAFFEAIETHHDVTAVTAICTPESLTVVVVVVIDHQADTYAFERVEHLAHRATNDVEEGVGTRRAHVTFRNQRVTFVAVAGCRTEVGPVVDREHDHWLTTGRQT